MLFRLRGDWEDPNIGLACPEGGGWEGLPYSLRFVYQHKMHAFIIVTLEKAGKTRPAKAISLSHSSCAHKAKSSVLCYSSLA